MKLTFKSFQNEKNKKTLKYLIMFFITFYVFSIPSFGQRETWNLITYFAMSVLGLLCFLYYLVFLPKKIDRGLYLIPAFSLYSFIGTAINSHQFRNWISIVLLAISFFVFYIAYRCIDNSKVVILIIIIGLTLFGIYYILHYRNQLLSYLVSEQEKFRLGTFFDNQNGVSAVAAMGLSLSLFVLLFYKNKIKWVAIIPVVVFLVVGLSTGSRTFVIASFAFVLLSTFLRFKNNKVTYFSVVALVALLFITIINLPFAHTLKERFIRLFNTFFVDDSITVDTSAIMRTLWFNYGFYLGNHSILFGNGAAGFSVVSGVGTYSHSNFAELYCDFGIVGLIIFYAPLVMCLYRCLKRKTPMSPLIVCMFVYYSIISFSNVFFYNKIYYAIIALLFYLVIDFKESIDLCPKKIVFTCDGMNSGGAEKVIATLSNELINKGVEVTIVGIASTVKKSFYVLDGQVNYITVNSAEKKYKFLSRVWRLRKIIRDEKPDAVISFLPHVNVYTWLALIGTSIPHIVSERNNPAINPSNKTLRFLKRLAFISARGCVFQTEEARDYFGRFVSKKSCIISNPISVDGSLAKTKDYKRSKTIICVGRLTEQKNIECAIDAFSLFHKNNPLFTMHIVGNGERYELLKEKIKSLNLDKNVFLDGLILDWQVIYHDAFAFILSSNYEGMPNALAEALAIGIPCISTDCEPGGPRKLIKNGENGLLVNVNSSAEIASCLELLLDEKLADKFQNSNVSMLETYSSSKICDSWISFISKIMNKNNVKV